MLNIDIESWRRSSHLIRRIDQRAARGGEASWRDFEYTDLVDEPTLVISDIQDDFVEFHKEAQALDRAGFWGMPVRREQSSSIPIALRALRELARSSQLTADGPYLDDDEASIEDLANEFAQRAELNRHFGEFDLSPMDDARQSMVELATISLAIRVAAHRGGLHNDANSPPMFFKKDIGGSRIQTPGCHFEVTSNTAGLRVFWSPAYRLSNNYFDYPTSPATGVLLAGAYIFGADDRAGSPICWDTGAVVNLPGTITSLHLAQ